MKYILFIGSKVGFEALTLMTNLRCHIIHVFIESEHKHEYEKYSQKSIDQCMKSNINFNIDANWTKVKELLSEKVNDGNSIDYIMSFGFRKMIPTSVLMQAEIATLGTHFSPLPRYRGFAPLNWVLINGEPETAVNLFYLEKEVDNGDIIDSEVVEISYKDDINTLFEKCIVTFRELLRRTIPKLEKGNFEVVKQDSQKATYTCARNPEDGLINWNWSANRIYNFIRALTYPFPGAYSFVNGHKVTIWSCEEYETPNFEGRVPGKVITILIDQGVVVLCGEGAILLKIIQMENKERQAANNVIKSVRLTLGITAMEGRNEENSDCINGKQTVLSI